MSVVHKMMNVAVVFVNRKGQQVPEGSEGAIELRSPGPGPGPGWRWTDFDGNQWTTAGAPIEGEFMPRWVRKADPASLPSVTEEQK